MRGKRQGALGAIAIGALAIAATAPASANATFGTLSYRTHGPVSMPVDAEGTVTASCRPGSFVIGGGQYVQAGFQNARVQSSAPFDGPDADTSPDDGWRSRIDGFNGAHNRVTEYAICSTRQPHYRKVSYVVNGLQIAGFSPKCPTGDTALGGGMDASPAYNSAYVLGSSPGPPQRPGTQWDSDGFAGFHNVVNQRVTGWSICGRAEVTYPSASNPVAGQSSGGASAACPRSTSLIGGGVRVSEPDPRNESDMLPTTFSPVDGRDRDLAPDDRWRVEGDNLALPGQGGTVRAIAVCLQ